MGELEPIVKLTAYDALVTMSGHGLDAAALAKRIEQAESLSAQAARRDELRVFVEAAKAWQGFTKAERAEECGGDCAPADALAADLLALDSKLRPLELDARIVKSKANDKKPAVAVNMAIAER